MAVRFSIQVPVFFGLDPAPAIHYVKQHLPKVDVWTFQAPLQVAQNEAFCLAGDFTAMDNLQLNNVQVTFANAVFWRADRFGSIKVLSLMAGGGTATAFNGNLGGGPLTAARVIGEADIKRAIALATLAKGVKNTQTTKTNITGINPGISGIF